MFATLVAAPSLVSRGDLWLLVVVFRVVVSKLLGSLSRQAKASSAAAGRAIFRLILRYFSARVVPPFASFSPTLKITILVVTSSKF